MSEAKHKLMQSVSDIEVKLRQRGLKLKDFLASVPVGAVTWSNWKHGRRTAHAETWQKVENAFAKLNPITKEQ